MELYVEDDEGVRSSSADSLTIRIIDKPENNDPVGVINSPQTGSTFDTNHLIQFSSQGSIDMDGDELLFTWSSSLDGEIYTTPSFFAESFLSDGVHLITLTVSDSNGGSDTVSVQITILLVNEQPTESSPLPALNLVSVISTIGLISIWRRP